MFFDNPIYGNYGILTNMSAYIKILTTACVCYFFNIIMWLGAVKSDESFKSITVYKDEKQAPF